jgi:hypothetical protein
MAIGDDISCTDGDGAVAVRVWHVQYAKSAGAFGWSSPCIAIIMSGIMHAGSLLHVADLAPPAREVAGPSSLSSASLPVVAGEPRRALGSSDTMTCAQLHFGGCFALYRLTATPHAVPCAARPC